MSDEEEDRIAEEMLRRQAISRETIYNHPERTLASEPINAKECLELQHRLKGLIVTKMDEVSRNHEIFDQLQNYDELYEQNFRHGVQSHLQDQQTYKDIREMHNMADILLHPPDFGGELALYQSRLPEQQVQQQIDQKFKEYEEAYRQNQRVEDETAEQAIRRARRFLLGGFEERP